MREDKQRVTCKECGWETEYMPHGDAQIAETEHNRERHGGLLVATLSSESNTTQ